MLQRTRPEILLKPLKTATRIHHFLKGIALNFRWVSVNYLFCSVANNNSVEVTSLYQADLNFTQFNGEQLLVLL